jgi:hypothetical protein
MSGALIEVKKFKANWIFGHYGQQKLGGGQKAKFYMRLLRPSETGRGSEGQILHEAIKAVRNWEGARRQNFTRISLSLLTTEVKCVNFNSFK